MQTTGAASDYELTLDGQPVPGALQADGRYLIEGVPPGRHRVAAIARDGMSGGYVTVELGEAERARAPDIVPEVGGQIVGMVTVKDDQGLRALEGVEVTAQPSGPVIMEEDETAVYPPPELPSFSAFTEEDGSYRIRAVPPGEYIVTVVAPGMEQGWRWVEVGLGRTAAADFLLRPTPVTGVGTVQGQVIGISEDGEVPLARARVTISTEIPWEPPGEIVEPPPPPELEPREGDDGDIPDATAIPRPDFTAVSTITDEQGRYSLNAPAGRAVIEVYLPGWEPAVAEIVIEAGETLVRNFELEPWDVELPPPPPGSDDGGDGDEAPPPPPDLQRRPAPQPPTPPFSGD
ncbi:MAG: carboxypeptidase-like regulatory domain-containing protein [Armatimonadota bacterium]|nr:carboxypeptidase-like regulatory domain-containing protein [Armatimonadota bacterium]